MKTHSRINQNQWNNGESKSR